MSSMDYSVAEMSCVLSASAQCEACRAKVYEILQNIYGVYTISMDAEEGIVEISGKVNPRALLRVLENSGKHAEVKTIRFDGEVIEKRYYHHGDDCTSHDLPYPLPLFDFPDQHHWLPPPPPSYPWQVTFPLPLPPPQPAPWPPQVPLPQSASWQMPMAPLPRPPSMIPAPAPAPAPTPWPPRPQPPPPPPDEALKGGETTVISSDSDTKHKCCTIM